MRALLLLAALATAAHAQTDTTSARRFLPLDVGNVWDYEYLPTDAAAERHRLTVASDTLIEGVRWASLTERIVFDGQLGPVAASARVRFDGDRLRLFDGDALSFTPLIVDCSFAPGASTQTCRLANFFNQPCEVDLTAGASETVVIGDESIVAVTRLAGTNGCEVQGRYAADIGFLGYATLGPPTILRYVRTRTVEAGMPLVVAGETPPTPVAALTVAPNPASRLVTVHAPGATRVEVADVLGRRVATAAPTAPGVWSVDVGGLAPGVYTVRAEATGAVTTARLTVAR